MKFDEDAEEVGKYKKKTDSNKSKASRKSNHRHKYTPCILSYPMLSRFNGSSDLGYALGSYCSICGKVGDIKFSETERISNSPLYRVLSDEEMLERHKALPIKSVNDIFDLYVSLDGDD